MSKIKAIVCLLMLGLLSLTVTGCSDSRVLPPQRTETRDFSTGFLPAEKEDKFTKVTENDRFILYANLKTGEAAVEDKASGETWYTNPVDKREDGYASGYNKNALLSVVTATYMTDLGANMTCGGFMSSVSKDGLTYRFEDDGSIIFMFDFVKEKFKIPVRYAVSDDRFLAQILTDGVQEYGTNKIKDIDFLPFFGAAGREQNGYMVVPDGSGALIRYNNGKTAASTFSKELYGFDNGVTDRGSLTLSETQFLPVFGSCREENGFLAVITGGEGRASVKADIAGKYTLYNTVWSSYSYRTVGIARQMQKDGNEEAVNIGEKKLETWEDYELSFFFLEEGKSDYAHLAEQYRTYLETERGLVQRVEEGEEIPFYLDLYGYIRKTKSFLGIPVDRKIPMTTAEDVKEILAVLSENGIDRVFVKYNYWMKDSYYGKIPVTADVESRVGSRDELLELQETLKKQGGDLYLSADLMNVYKLGRGVSKYNDVLQSVANTAQRQFRFDMSAALLETPMKDSKYGTWYLLKPASFEEFFGKLTDNMIKEGYENLALDAVGEMCYSELSSSGMGKNFVTDTLYDTVAWTSEQIGGLMLTGAMEYAAVSAEHILNTPGKASNYDIEDESIPFYQMVFHSYASYALEAANLSSNPADQTLSCMEYGAYPMYSLVGRNVDELVGSRTDRLYSADYRNWMDYAGEQYRLLSEVLSEVQTSRMTGHEISGRVRKTSYENGIEVYVNYDETQQSMDGYEIPAKGYMTVKGNTVLHTGTVDNEAEGGRQ